MSCPVCSSSRFASTCPDCGFDPSRDYDRFPTFGPVGKALSRAALRSRLAPADAQRCEKCGGTSFVIRVPDNTRRCSSCGWSPEERPILRCTCGSPYFTARLSDGALMCPLCSRSIPLEDFLKALHRPIAVPAPQPAAPEPPAFKSLLDSLKTQPRTVPVTPDPKPVITAIAAGDAHTVILFSDGTVRAVGDHSQGQCNVSSWSNIKAIAAGSKHTVGLRHDGTVVAAGASVSKRHVANHCCAVDKWKGVTAIAAGADFTLGLRKDGTVLSAGSDMDLRHMTDTRIIAAGYRHMAGIRNASVLPDPRANWKLNHWSGVTAVALGEDHIVGLTENGTTVATGANDYGQCYATWNGIQSIAAGRAFTVALRKNGSMVAAGDNRAGQCNVIGWHGISAIAAGASHTVALKNDGTLIATGDNSWGQCNIHDIK